MTDAKPPHQHQAYRGCKAAASVSGLRDSLQIAALHEHRSQQVKADQQEEIADQATDEL